MDFISLDILYNFLITVVTECALSVYLLWRKLMLQDTCFVCFDSLHPSQQDGFFLGWTSNKQRIMCLAQEHNTVRLKPALPWSWVKHSTTESLRSSNLSLWWFRLKDLSIDEMVGAWCFGCLSGPPGFTCWISFAPVFSLIYCWVLILALSPCYILIYMF